MQSGRFYLPFPTSYVERQVPTGVVVASPLIIHNDITVASLSIVCSQAADAVSQQCRIGVASSNNGAIGSLLFEGDSDGNLANPGGSGEVTIACGDQLAAGRYWTLCYIGSATGGNEGNAFVRSIPRNIQSGQSVFLGNGPYLVGDTAPETAQEGQNAVSLLANVNGSSYASLAAALADLADSFQSSQDAPLLVVEVA